MFAPSCVFYVPPYLQDAGKVKCDERIHQCRDQYLKTLPFSHFVRKGDVEECVKLQKTIDDAVQMWKETLFMRVKRIYYCYDQKDIENLNLTIVQWADDIKKLNMNIPFCQVRCKVQQLFQERIERYNNQCLGNIDDNMCHQKLQWFVGQKPLSLEEARVLVPMLFKVREEQGVVNDINEEQGVVNDINDIIYRVIQEKKRVLYERVKHISSKKEIQKMINGWGVEIGKLHLHDSYDAQKDLRAQIEIKIEQEFEERIKKYNIGEYVGDLERIEGEKLEWFIEQDLITLKKALSFVPVPYCMERLVRCRLAPHLIQEQAQELHRRVEQYITPQMQQEMKKRISEWVIEITQLKWSVHNCNMVQVKTEFEERIKQYNIKQFTEQLHAFVCFHDKINDENFIYEYIEKVGNQKFKFIKKKITLSEAFSLIPIPFQVWKMSCDSLIKHKQYMGYNLVDMQTVVCY